MRHARTAVVRVWLSRNEPPTPGPGHEGGLDPDCDPDLGSHCRRIPAAAGPWGRLLLSAVWEIVILPIYKLAIRKVY